MYNYHKGYQVQFNIIAWEMSHYAFWWSLANKKRAINA